MSKRISIIVLAGLVLFALVGCSKPPEAEMQKANATFDQAKAAEAEQYVPDSYRAAMDTLNAAMAMKQEQDSKFSLFRSYGKSKVLFVKADELASKAVSDAAAEKERVKAQVSDMLAQAKAAIDSANAALAKAPRGKGSKADIELMKSDIGAAQAGYDDAMNDFNAGKYLTARTKTQAVMDKANKVSMDIATAFAKKTGK
jgi:hypothetical protein